MSRDICIMRAPRSLRGVFRKRASARGATQTAGGRVRPEQENHCMQMPASVTALKIAMVHWCARLTDLETPSYRKGGEDPDEIRFALVRSMSNFRSEERRVGKE